MKQPPRPLRILIADDSRCIRDGLVAILCDLPQFEVVGEVETAPDALDAIRRLRPDVVVLDIRMPGGSGIDVLATVKKEMPGMIVIMFTLMSTMRRTCEELGADYFFDKADKIAAFVETLSSLTGVPADGEGGEPERRMRHERDEASTRAEGDTTAAALWFSQFGTVFP